MRKSTTRKTSKPVGVAMYLASAPKGVQPALRRLRALIRTAVPDAVEGISYGMPYYHQEGRVAYFRLAKHHLGLYLPTPIVERHAKELGVLASSKATIQLPLDGKWPVALLKKMLRERVRMNMDLAAAKRRARR